MIQDEYKRLLEMIEKSGNLEVSLEEILQEAVVFFETLRSEFPKASKEKRNELIQMMTHLHTKLQEVSKKSAEASGMTEEELSSFAENPSNFSPEQWQLVQSTRRKLYDSARQFSSTLNKEKKEQASEGEEVNEPPKKKSIRPKTRRSKRSDWTKS